MIPRLYVDQPLQEGATLDISSQQSHYLKHVLRRNVSDHCHVFNGRDGEWDASVISLEKKLGVLAVHDQTRPQYSEPDIWLVFAKIKRQAVDMIVEKGTELGVTRFLPVFTERSGAKSETPARLEAIAIEAAEQSERLTIPAIEAPGNLLDIIKTTCQGRNILLCDETGKGEPIGEALAAAPHSAFWAILIGPEGGFSPTELEKLRANSHVVPVGMGPRILRADTAAIAALTCWQAHLGDWNQPPQFSGA